MAHLGLDLVGHAVQPHVAHGRLGADAGAVDHLAEQRIAGGVGGVEHGQADQRLGRRAAGVIDTLVVDHEHVQVLAHELALAVVEGRERALGSVRVHVLHRLLEQHLRLSRRGALAGVHADAGEGRERECGQGPGLRVMLHRLNSMVAEICEVESGCLEVGTTQCGPGAAASGPQSRPLASPAGGARASAPRGISSCAA